MAHITALNTILNKQNLEFRGDIVRLEQNIYHLTAVIKDLNAKIVKLEKAIKAKDAVIAANQTTILAQAAKIINLTGVIKQRDATIQTLKSTIAEKDVEIARLNKIIADGKHYENLYYMEKATLDILGHHLVYNGDQIFNFFTECLGDRMYQPGATKKTCFQNLVKHTNRGFTREYLPKDPFESRIVRMPRWTLNHFETWMTMMEGTAAPTNANYTHPWFYQKDMSRQTHSGFGRVAEWAQKYMWDSDMQMSPYAKIQKFYRRQSGPEAYALASQPWDDFRFPYTDSPPLLNKTLAKDCYVKFGPFINDLMYYMTHRANHTKVFHDYTMAAEAYAHAHSDVKAYVQTNISKLYCPFSRDSGNLSGFKSEQIDASTLSYLLYSEADAGGSKDP